MYVRRTYSLLAELNLPPSMLVLAFYCVAGYTLHTHTYRAQRVTLPTDLVSSRPANYPPIMPKLSLPEIWNGGEAKTVVVGIGTLIDRRNSSFL